MNSFTFYRDYYNLIDTLPNKEDKMILLEAITDYMFKDIEPVLDGHNLAIFNTLKAQLNVSKNNSVRRVKNNQEETEQETERQTEEKPKKEPEDKPEKNKTSILSFKFYISNLNINNSLKEIINKWLDYKLEIKDLYKSEIGFKTLVNKIIKNSEIYGEDKIIELINDAISNGYKGIVWDRLNVYNRQKTQRQKDDEFWERFDKELEDEKRGNKKGT